MKILFIGGSGQISQAVSQEAIRRNLDLYVLNRGNRNTVLPKGVHILKGDINDKATIIPHLKAHDFDCIVQWIAFTKDHLKRDYELFKGHTKQYIFISSASAYQKPLLKTPITEAMPIGNQYWTYSENKAQAENYLTALGDSEFNITIVRPSHTYDDKRILMQLKPNDDHTYTMLNRMLKNKPIVVPNDGKTLWTLTHNSDFANAFCDLLGNPSAYNETYHLTSDKVYTWDEITKIIYRALDRSPNILHIPVDFILKYFPHVEGELKGDKLSDAVFDNRKIKAISPNYTSKVGYEAIVDKAVAYYLDDSSNQKIDEAFEKTYDKMIDDYLKS